MRRSKRLQKAGNRTKKSKNRFVGGVQIQCPTCKSFYHSYDKLAPALSRQKEYGTTYDTYYEDHVKTHPVCKYCGESLMDINALIEHLKTNHNDKYLIAQKLHPTFSEKSLLQELQSENPIIVGISPNFSLFYSKIDEQEKKATAIKPANKTIKKSKKTINPILPPPPPAELSHREVLPRKTLASQAVEPLLMEPPPPPLSMEPQMPSPPPPREAEPLSMEPPAEKAKKIISTAKEEKHKAKKEAKRQEEAKKQAIEIDAMGQEDQLATSLMKHAESVEDVITIIDSHLKPNINTPVTAHVQQKQRPINLEEMLAFMDIHDNIQQYIHNIEFSDKTNTNMMYMHYNNILMYIIGYINLQLHNLDIDLKLVLKGGKAAQMLLHKHRVNKSIKSDDIDILLVQTRHAYDRDYLLNFAMQFGRFMIKYPYISMLDPLSEMLENKNIVKISVKTGNKYIPLSDIDISEPTQFYNNIDSMNIGIGKNHYNTQNLLYYFQNKEDFIEEKQYYFNIYDDIIQKIPNSDKTCNCNIKEIKTYECFTQCNYRTLMIEKFKKYLKLFE